MIRNLVFDMGNVLIRFDPEMFMNREGITDPADRQLIMRELFLSAEWAMMDAGMLTEETAEPAILPHFPERLHKSVLRLLYRWADPKEVIPGMEDLVSRIHSSGYGLFLLSNASKAQHVYWPKYSVSRYFDGKMISCDVMTVKPCHEIYHLFTQRFSLRPEECLFVDDTPANVAGAIACGWQGIVFHGDVSELEKKMKQYGIQVPL